MRAGEGGVPAVIPGGVFTPRQESRACQPLLRGPAQPAARSARLARQPRSCTQRLEEEKRRKLTSRGASGPVSSRAVGRSCAAALGLAGLTPTALVLPERVVVSARHASVGGGWRVGGGVAPCTQPPHMASGTSAKGEYQAESSDPRGD